MTATTSNEGDIEPSANLIESTFPECKHLTGRKRQICRNEADLPLNGPHSVNAYRTAWGLAPIGDNPQREPASTGSPKKPTLIQSALTLASVVAQTAKRGSLLDEATIAQRLSICQSCEHYTGTSCKLCGCGCGGAKKLTNKLAHAASSCADTANPRWGPVHTEQNTSNSQ